MARVTVEDCVERVPNRFELVMYAAQRARNISAGAELTLDRDNDKNPVVALREIAEEQIPPNELEDALIKGQQRVVGMEEFEDDEDLELLEDQQAEGANPDMEAEMSADALSIADDTVASEEAGEVEVVADPVAEDAPTAE